MRAVGLAAIVAAGVAAGGFGLLQVALPRAGSGDVAAAKAARGLSHYHEAVGEISVGRRNVRATCYHGWIDGLGGRDRRGTLLQLSNGATIRDIPPHTLVSQGPVVTHRLVALLQAAGCTKVLGDRLAELAQFDGGVGARHVHVNGDGALAIRFPRLTVLVDARTGRPLGVDEPTARGIIRLVRVRHPPT